MGNLLKLKLTEEQLRAAGMQGVSENVLIGQAARVKKLIDGTGNLAALEGLNKIIDALDSITAAEGIGARPFNTFAGENMQALLQELYADLQGKIDDLIVGTLPADSVDTKKLKNGAVTEEKLADGAVSPQKLEGKYYTQEESLSPDVAAMFGLSENAVPNDAFFLLCSKGYRYAYAIEAKYDNGMPVAGQAVTGLVSSNGGALTTDSSGRCVGLSNNQTATIGIAMLNYVDVTGKTVSATATGKITSVPITIERRAETSLTITSSRTVNFSAMVDTIDYCLVGGGEDGGSGDGTSYGNGGDSGDIVNRMNVKPLNSSVTIGQASWVGGNTTAFGVTAYGGGNSSSNKSGGIGGARSSLGNMDGTDRTVIPFNDPTIQAGGGGAAGDARSAGKSFGGTRNGGAARGFGGGGGGMRNVSPYPGGKGYQGCLMLRWRYKQS